MKERMNGWMDGRQDGWMSELAPCWDNALCHTGIANPHSRSDASTDIRAALTMGTNLRYSERLIILQLFVQWSSCYSLVHILLTSSSKSTPRLPAFWTFWHANRALAQSCALFVDNFPHPRKQRPCFGDSRSHITPKNTRFQARGCFFSPVGSHASELLHFPTTWWWVVDMMMWLTWDPVDRMVCMHFVLNILTMFLKFYYITLH